MKFLKIFGFWVKRVFIYPLKNKPNEFKRLSYRGYNYCRIADWQQRERKIKYKRIIRTVKPTDTKYAYHVQKNVLREIKYKRDIKNYGSKEYWATTDEIIKRGCGDCEDIAFVIMRRLIETGYNPKDIGIILARSHAFCGLWLNNKNFWILDSGFLVNYIVKASLFFKKYQIRLFCGFNRNDIWDL